MRFLSPRSLRVRLLLTILVSMIILLAAGGTMIHELFKKRLLDDLDDSLRTQLDFYRVISVQEDNMIHFDMTFDEMQRQKDPEYPIFAQYRLARDARHYHYSKNLGENDLPPIGLGSEDPVLETFTLFNNKPARAVGVEFLPTNLDDKPTMRLHVVIAQELSSVYDSLQKLRRLMLNVGGVLTLLLLLPISFIVHRSLRPLRELSEQIDATPIIGGAHFAPRGAPAELDPMVGRLNALMDRVQSAIDRERDFTANAAHELRNPLAGMRSQIELSLGTDRSPEKYRETLTGLYDIQQGMERVVQNLLILARLEAGEQEPQQDIVPLTDVLRRGWRKVYDAAEKKEIKVTWKVQNDLPVIKTSRNLVSIIVRNLLDNAVDYSPHGGYVQIAAHYDHLVQKASIRVTNQNTKLTEEDCEQMFELFWRRQDDNTDRTHRHSGLGLALCRRIVGVLGGEIQVRLTEGQQQVELLCSFPCEIHSD